MTVRLTQTVFIAATRRRAEKFFGLFSPDGFDELKPISRVFDKVLLFAGEGLGQGDDVV